MKYIIFLIFINKVKICINNLKNVMHNNNTFFFDYYYNEI